MHSFGAWYFLLVNRRPSVAHDRRVHLHRVHDRQTNDRSIWKNVTCHPTCSAMMIGFDGPVDCFGARYTRGHSRRINLIGKILGLLLQGNSGVSLDGCSDASLDVSLSGSLDVLDGCPDVSLDGYPDVLLGAPLGGNPAVFQGASPAWLRIPCRGAKFGPLPASCQVG